MSTDPAALERAKEIIKQLWERHKGSVFERLVALEQASADVLLLDPDQLTEARSVAHKLAGSLGTFGFHAGSDWARDSENIFASGVFGDVECERLVQNAANIRQLLETPQ